MLDITVLQNTITTMLTTD